MRVQREIAPLRETCQAGKLLDASLGESLKAAMKKLLAIIALAILTGVVARAAQVGDTVFGFVSVENRVELAVSNDPQEVLHIV